MVVWGVFLSHGAVNSSRAGEQLFLRKHKTVAEKQFNNV